MLKGTKEGVAIGSEAFKNGLFATELTLVVGVAGTKLVGQLGTVVRMGVSGSLHRIVAGRCALISLGTVMSVIVQVV